MEVIWIKYYSYPYFRYCTASCSLCNKYKLGLLRIVKDFNGFSDMEKDDIFAFLNEPKSASICRKYKRYTDCKNSFLIYDTH